MNKKLDLVCNASDIFKTNIATIKGLSNNIEVQYRNYYFPRNIRFSVVYRFGNKSLKSKQQKLSNEEERQRRTSILICKLEDLLASIICPIKRIKNYMANQMER